MILDPDGHLVGNLWSITPRSDIYLVPLSSCSWIKAHFAVHIVVIYSLSALHCKKYGSDKSFLLPPKLSLTVMSLTWLGKAGYDKRNGSCGQPLDMVALWHKWVALLLTDQPNTKGTSAQYRHGYLTKTTVADTGPVTACFIRRIKKYEIWIHHYSNWQELHGDGGPTSCHSMCGPSKNFQWKRTTFMYGRTTVEICMLFHSLTKTKKYVCNQESIVR